VRIAVQDEGPGIRADMRNRIFEKYAVGQPLHADSGHQSTGLGLAFCKLAAEAHGGSIHIEDATPRGAVFVVELPA
jgi:signal transduction histidine kinase